MPMTNDGLGFGNSVDKVGPNQGSPVFSVFWTIMDLDNDGCVHHRNSWAETMTMPKNPILDELHAIRERLLADAGGTLDALVDRLQVEEQQSDRPRFHTRRTKPCSGAEKSSDFEVENHSSPPGDL